MIPLDHEVTKGLHKQALSIYGHELWYLALSIKNRCEKVFAATPPPTSGHYIKVDATVHAEIFGILSQAAGLKKLVLTPSARLDGESRRAFNLRRFRAHSLFEAIRPLNLVEILDAKVRNTIEHFDEYLDKAVLQVSDEANRPSPWAAYNMVLSDRDIFNPRAYPIRVYIVSDKTFHNMRWSVSLERIHTEASRLVDFLGQSGKFPKDQDPGGLLLIFEGANKALQTDVPRPAGAGRG